MRKTLAAVCLTLSLTSCQALQDFGEGLKTGICDAIEPVKSGVTAALSLLGPIGAIAAAPINLGLETMCRGTQFGVTVITNPVMIPEAAVEGVEGIVGAVTQPFKGKAEPDGENGRQ